MTSRRRYRLLVRRGLRELRAAVLDLVLPRHCPGCGGPVTDRSLCGPCAAHLQRRPPSGCVRCGEPLLAGQACRADHRLLQGLDWAASPYSYAGTGGALVRRLKLRGDFGALPLLARGMAMAAARHLVAPWRRPLLVPVPLHATRRRERGFDQAWLLAQGVAAAVDGHAVQGALVRRRATLPQGDPRVLSRERNVAAAFAVARPQVFLGATVVLVDDVMTSGATARTCAAAARAAGALRVGVVTACRA